MAKYENMEFEVLLKWRINSMDDNKEYFAFISYKREDEKSKLDTAEDVNEWQTIRI